MSVLTILANCAPLTSQCRNLSFAVAGHDLEQRHSCLSLHLLACRLTMLWPDMLFYEVLTHLKLPSSYVVAKQLCTMHEWGLFLAIMNCNDFIFDAIIYYIANKVLKVFPCIFRSKTSVMHHQSFVWKWWKWYNLHTKDFPVSSMFWRVVFPLFYLK